MKTLSWFVLLLLVSYGCRKEPENEPTQDQILNGKISYNVSLVRKGQMSLKQNAELSQLISSNTNEALRVRYFTKWAKELLSTTIRDIESDNPRRCMLFIYDIIDREIESKFRCVTGGEVLRFDLKLDLIDWLRNRLDEVGRFYADKWGDFDVAPHLYDEKRTRWHECYISLYHCYRSSITRLESGSDYYDLLEVKMEIREEIIRKIEKRLGRKMRSPESARAYSVWAAENEKLRKIKRNLFPWPQEENSAVGN
jgi:hypothetical protein